MGALGVAVMPTSWPSAVLVDLDNTLHDYRSAAARLRSALALRIEQEHDIPREVVLKRYEQLVAAEDDAMFATGYDLRIARLKSLLDSWSETRRVGPAPFAEFIETALLNGVRPFAGAIEAYRILEAKGRTMVLTAGYADIQGAIAKRLGLSVDPNDFLVTKTHNVRKADGTAFRLAGELLQVAVDDVVVVGDNWDWDIVGAAKAGMWQVWIGSDDRDHTDAPNRYLGKEAAFRDLPTFLASSWRNR